MSNEQYKIPAIIALIIAIIGIINLKINPPAEVKPIIGQVSGTVVSIINKPNFVEYELKVSESKNIRVCSSAPKNINLGDNIKIEVEQKLFSLCNYTIHDQN